MIRLDELNVTLVRRHGSLALDVRPRVNPRGPQKQTDAPSTTDHDSCLTSRPFRSVSQRPRHAEVPVEADDEQVQDRRVRRQIVQSQPRVA